MSGILVTGTDTDVGKTWITGALVGLLREQGVDAMAWKPVQSGVVEGDFRGDSAQLKWLGNLPVHESDICPTTLAEPLAPALAARRAGVILSPQSWQRQVQTLLQTHEFLFVEGAGGITVPLAGDYRVHHLAEDTNLPLLLVAKAGLGTVNSILLTIEFAKQRGLPVLGIILNGAGKDGGSLAEETNVGLIQTCTDVPILGRVPWLIGSPTRQQILDAVRENIDVAKLRLQLDL